METAFIILIAALIVIGFASFFMYIIAEDKKAIWVDKKGNEYQVIGCEMAIDATTKRRYDAYRILRLSDNKTLIVDQDSFLLDYDLKKYTDGERDG